MAKESVVDVVKRWQKIDRYLFHLPVGMTIKQLAKVCGVSNDTIRRDIEAMNEVSGSYPIVAKKQVDEKEYYYTYPHLNAAMLTPEEVADGSPRPLARPMFVATELRQGTPGSKQYKKGPHSKDCSVSTQMAQSGG